MIWLGNVFEGTLEAYPNAGGVFINAGHTLRGGGYYSNGKDELVSLRCIWPLTLGPGNHLGTRAVLVF